MASTGDLINAGDPASSGDLANTGDPASTGDLANAGDLAGGSELASTGELARLLIRLPAGLVGAGALMADAVGRVSVGRWAGGTIA